MHESILIGLAAILVLGILSQWIAWSTHFPSILILIITGFIVGPVTGFLDPDLLFGDLLIPVVSFSVAVILYEGGLNLNIGELKKIGNPVISLISIGALITLVLTSAAAHYILGFDFKLAVLFGAILVVTGPTVIIPMIRQIRPAGKIGKILKWEGIVIDPIGAVLAVLVFEAMLIGGVKEAAQVTAIAIAKTVLIGGISGIAGGVVLMFLIRRYLMPDFLHNPASLMIMAVVYVASNHFQHESGLLAATVMGIFLASQNMINIRPILEFKENLRVLLISALFIVLAARLPIDALQYFNWKFVLFMVVLIVLIRPLSVLASTIGAKLDLKEKTFLSFMAPRGIVAAAVASIFELKLEAAGYSEPRIIVYFVFLVIIGTILVYGLGAPVAGRLLGVARSNPQGVLIVGAHSWAREIAKSLQAEGFKVMLIDSSVINFTESKMDGFDVHFGSVLQPNLLYRLEFDEMGKLLALTSNDEVNILSALRFRKFFGREGVFRLFSRSESVSADKIVRSQLRARLLFGAKATFDGMDGRFEHGAIIKNTKITKEFDYQKYLELYGHDTIPLFIINAKRELFIYTRDNFREPKPGETLVSIVDKPE